MSATYSACVASPGSADVGEISFRRAEALISKLPVAGPRYTSYPTVPHWSERFGPREHEDALARTASHTAVSLYTHVPFCRALCHFCACHRVITRDADLVERYLDAVVQEIETTRAAIGRGLPCEQLHWGGGTPTHLTPVQIERLHRAQADAFPIASGAERSIEIDPRVTSDDHLRVLRACGFNRLSLGVQDTHPETQAAIHRIQPFARTLVIVEGARALGIEKINFDLVYGLPHQTVASFDATIDDVLAAQPDRIALYGYAHVTWVAKQQRGFERMDLPDSARRLRIQLHAIERLTAAGYRFIGMDHFARPDDELTRALDDGSLRRNFMGYTTREGLPIVAFGPSGISELPGAYAQAAKDLEGWRDRVARGFLATERGVALTLDDEARRWIIGRVMCTGSVAADEVALRFGPSGAAAYRAACEELAPLVRESLVRFEGAGDLALSELGRLFVRPVAMAFDAYLDGQGGGSTAPARFSRTV